MESISGIKHPAFRDALALTRQGGRETARRYLVEDADAVRQALQSPADVFAVFALPDAVEGLREECARRDTPLYIVGSGLVAKLLGTGYSTATTAVAVVGQKLVAAETLLTADALVLAGERIQDPRNVGVLVRTAEAAGASGLLLSEDSAEPFSRQAVRSTTGSLLRLPLAIAPDLPKTLQALREKGAKIVVTSARAPHLAYDVDLSTRPLVLLVGNETGGISAAAAETATDFVRLPMAPNGASSLNVTVAAGALLYRSGAPASCRAKINTESGRETTVTAAIPRQRQRTVARRAARRFRSPRKFAGRRTRRSADSDKLLTVALPRSQSSVRVCSRRRRGLICGGGRFAGKNPRFLRQAKYLRARGVAARTDGGCRVQRRHLVSAGYAPAG
jgi:TrmH family RNA methyltransferase